MGHGSELQPLPIPLWSVLGKGLRKVQTPEDVMAGCISTAVSPGVSTEQPAMLFAACQRPQLVPSGSAGKWRASPEGQL